MRRNKSKFRSLWYDTTESSVLLLSFIPAQPGIDGATTLSWLSACLVRVVDTYEQLPSYDPSLPPRWLRLSFPILAFFCKSATSGDDTNTTTTPLDLTKSLIVQLMKFIAEDPLAIDLESCRDFYSDEAWEDISQTGIELDRDQPRYLSEMDVKTGMDLFDRLVELLPDGERVIIIIDRLYELGGERKERNAVMRFLASTIDVHKHLKIKALLDGVPAASFAEKMADVSITMRDTGVPGDNGGITETVNRRRDQEARLESSRWENFEDDDNLAAGLGETLSR
ncbi:hypothetical protein B0H66DRAFT_609586 [Apodospora peruviana]|uniref:Uncharacterized protein n=1 Tax=Apodospora peruviana TaxID=516989 RepID=A0AAE0IPT8_9PEZI|nr:hypothetical protein B0H66DRAFT_609586 [Apodospora peruviana]